MALREDIKEREDISLTELYAMYGILDGKINFRDRAIIDGMDHKRDVKSAIDQQIDDMRYDMESAAKKNERREQYGPQRAEARNWFQESGN